MCGCLSRFHIITVIIVSTGRTIGGSRARFPAGAGNFLFTTASRTALGPTKPPIQWVPGALSPGLKRPVCETDHSRPFSATVKNAWSYTSAPQYVFMAWCLVKHRDNFTFTFNFIISTATNIMYKGIYIYQTCQSGHCAADNANILYLHQFRYLNNRMPDRHQV
jgi:hypothetical protein